MPGKWQIINGVKYPTEHNTDVQEPIVQASQRRSFIHEGKEWTEVKTISLDQVLKILAAKDSRQTEMTVRDKHSSILKPITLYPQKWHCGTGSCKKARENYVYCQKERCAIIGFCEKAPGTTKGGFPAWKQAHSFIRKVQLNDQLFLHNGSSGVEGGKGFVTHQGFFTGDITTNDPEVLRSEVKRDIPEGVRVKFDKDLTDYRPPGWPKDAETTEGGKLIFYKIKVSEWTPLKRKVKGAGWRATLYTNEKTAMYSNPQ